MLYIFYLLLSHVYICVRWPPSITPRPAHDRYFTHVPPLTPCGGIPSDNKYMYQSLSITWRSSWLNSVATEGFNFLYSLPSPVFSKVSWVEFCFRAAGCATNCAKFDYICSPSVPTYSKLFPLLTVDHKLSGCYYLSIFYFGLPIFKILRAEPEPQMLKHRG